MNIAKMMQQVQQMQGKMTEMQNRLSELEVTGQSGGGLVTATMNGKNELRKIKIDPKLADDLEMLEDLIVAAIGDAKAKIDAQTASETEKVMGGLQLPPGVKLPF
jgi:DNA-binding YbaB/EbfC family protein